MFVSARLKLTAWYLLIIMLISGLFSLAFYQISTREIQHIITRLQSERVHLGNTVFIVTPQGVPSIEELEEVKQHLAASLIMLNGCILVLAGAASYILANKTLQPIQQMVDEQQEFISNASHELRTPIAILRAEMEASLMEKRISDRQARALIVSNLEELTRLQNLSNYLLQITRLHSAGNPQPMKDVPLHNSLREAVRKITPLAKKKRIRVVMENSKAVVRGDQEALLNVFIILLDNAVKYTPNGGKVSVSTTISKQTAIVSVQDTGIGIAKQDLPHIFQRFYRADKSRQHTDGYGLGLAIAKQTVESYQGTIEVHSELSKGTTMIVTLPIVTQV